MEFSFKKRVGNSTYHYRVWEVSDPKLELNSLQGGMMNWRVLKELLSTPTKFAVAYSVHLEDDLAQSEVDQYDLYAGDGYIYASSCNTFAFIHFTCNGTESCQELPGILVIRNGVAIDEFGRPESFIGHIISVLGELNKVGT